MILSCRATLLAGAALCLLTSLPAAAQTAASGTAQAADGQISGVVVDRNGNLVAGATVQLEGSNLVETTGPDGRFLIRSAPAGQARVLVRYFGSDPATQDVVVAAGTTAELRIALGGAETFNADGDIVVVASRPIAESEAAALQLQRSSTALVSVIAADSIGRFPDQNIAASLGRLPGVAVQRDQGQDRFISLRGARTSWTTISFDGINVISPAGRTTRFDTIPSAIASKVAVRKAVTADLTGEAVAGQVDIMTRSAFDYPAMKVAADIGLGFSELGGGRQYNFTTHVSDRFFNDTVGILLSASRFEVDMITDNFEAGWEVAPEDREAGSESRIWANNTQNKLYRLTRSNTAFSGRLDWRPSTEHEFFLSSVHTEFRDDELRSAYVFDFDDGAVRTDSTASQLTARRTGYADIRTGNTPLNGTIYGGEIDSTLNSNSSRQRIFTNTLGGNHILGDWGATWRLNYTRAQADSRPPFQSTWRSPANRALRPSIVYDLSNPDLHKVQLYDTLVDANGNYSLGNPRAGITPTELEFVTFTRNNQRDQTDAYTARLDFDRVVQLFGHDTKIQFGGQYNERTKESNRTVIEARAPDLEAAGIALPRQSAFSINDPLKVGIPLGYSFRYFDSEAGAALLDSYIAAGASRIQPNTSQNNNYVVTEKVYAGYLMGTMYFDRGNIVAGARVERVDNTGTALVNFGGTFVPTTTGSGNTMVFPSIHLNYDATDEIKLRLSVNTGAARPDYTLLRPNFTFSDQAETVSGGNPFATPEKAVGVDAYFEWYMANRGFLSVGVYYKKIRDVLFDSQLPQFGSNVLNSDGIDRSVYLYNTTINGGEGEIKGLELAYSQPFEGLLKSIGAPEWLQGFGFQGNLTLNDSTAKTPDGRNVKLPGASDLIYNASLYYEQYGLSLRASWQKRDAWLDGLGNPDVGDNYWSSVGRLDLSARYAISPRVELFVDANNLLDEPGIRYVGNPSRTIEFEKFGARFMGGVRINLGGSGPRR